MIMNKEGFKEAESPKDSVPNSGRRTSLVFLTEIPGTGGVGVGGACEGTRNFLCM